MNDAPKLLVEWSSRREEFLSAIGPAFGRSPKKLAGEAQTGLFPYWGILVSWAVELLLLVAVIVLPAKLASMQPYEPPPKPKYDVIYYSAMNCRAPKTSAAPKPDAPVARADRKLIIQHKPSGWRAVLRYEKPWLTPPS